MEFVEKMVEALRLQLIKDGVATAEEIENAVRKLRDDQTEKAKGQFSYKLGVKSSEFT